MQHEHSWMIFKTKLTHQTVNRSAGINTNSNTTKHWTNYCNVPVIITAGFIAVRILYKWDNNSLYINNKVSIPGWSPNQFFFLDHKAKILALAIMASFNISLR